MRIDIARRCPNGRGPHHIVNVKITFPGEDVILDRICARCGLRDSYIQEA